MMLDYIRYANESKDNKMTPVEHIFARLFCHRGSIVSGCMEPTQFGHRWLTLLENRGGWAVKTIIFI